MAGTGDEAAAGCRVRVELRLAHGQGRGTFETLICAGCGYTEWYAIGALAEDEKAGVRLIDAEPPRPEGYRK